MKLIRTMCDPIAARGRIHFRHLSCTEKQSESVRADRPADQVLTLWRGWRETLPAADPALLADLECEGLPTIKTMVLGDRVVRYLPQELVMRYATMLARRFDAVYCAVRPTLVLGGFDSLHGGIGLAVARRLGIPWAAMHFSTLPRGLFSFCRGITPDTVLDIPGLSESELTRLGAKTLREFREDSVHVPAYQSANSLGMIIARFPKHVTVLSRILRDSLLGRRDIFTTPSPAAVCALYLRKRCNLLLLPRRQLLQKPPSGRFAFFALHMQPESSIDTWAPYCSNQPHVIETLARSLPADVRLLVKLHKSDADRYLPAELRALTDYPGVSLVSPFASSREFITKAALVVSIQGTIGVESALLGKPVLTLAGNRLPEFPNVVRARAPEEWTSQIRELLRRPTPCDAEIVAGFVGYYRNYAPGCYNDWERVLSSEEVAAVGDHLERLLEALRQGEAG